MNKKIKIGILAIACAQMGTMAFTPCIGGMAAAFPDAPTVYVQLILSIPAMIGCITGILAGRLSNKIPMKYTACLGLLIMVLTGIWASTAQSMLTLVISSTVMGLGIGTIGTVCAALCNFYFEGAENEKLMGYITTAGCLGGMAMVTAGGYLAEISWRYNFLIYLVLIIIIVIALVTLPADIVKENKGNEIKGKVTISGAAIGYAAILIPVMICYNSFPANISMYTGEVGLGNSVAAGYSTMIFLFAGVVGGFIFGKYCQISGRLSLGVSIILGGLGFLLMIGLPNTITIMLGCFIVGLGMNFFIPGCIVGAGTSSDTVSAPTAIAIAMATCNVGQFLSSIVLNPAAEMTGNSSAYMRYLISAIGLIVIGILVSALFMMRKKEAQ